MAITLHGTVSDNTVALDRKSATPLIINGDMAIAQRGTSQTGQTGNHFPVDRFGFQMDTFGTWTSSQSTDVPTGQGFAKSLKLDCTTADASLGAGHFGFISHRFEGQNLQVLKKGTSNAEKVTISFWVKSNKTGNYVMELFDVDNLRQISQLYSISSSNTWEQKVMTFAADTTGALGDDNGHSFAIHWVLGAGSTYSSGTLNTSWAPNNNANRWVGGPNLADSTSNDFYITGVQLEIGTFDANSIPAFQFEDRGTSLARCQRYCIVYGTGEASYQQLGETGISTSTTQAQITFNHPTEMRTIPSLSNSGALALGQGTSLIGMTVIAINTSNDTRQSTGVIATVASGLTAHKPYRIDQSNSSSSIVIFDSEL